MIYEEPKLEVIGFHEGEIVTAGLDVSTGDSGETSWGDLWG